MKYLTLLFAFYLTSCAQAQINPNLQLQPVLTGLSSPVLATNARDGSNRLFIVEQTGRIKILQPDGTSTTDFINLSGKIVAGGERGLLGLAFHPNYKSNRRFFVNYTRSGDGATVIAEYQASASDRNVALATEKILLTITQPYANHNGGMIEFGPDGFLYIGMGDGGSGNDPQNNAQNIESLLGKMLRIDVDRTQGALAYAIPVDNVFAGATAGRDEIFAYGLRNPWRWSFDRQTGQLIAGDVGQNAREWVHTVQGGKNYGWATWEGTRCNTSKPPGSPECINLPLIQPLLEYDHSAGRCSITGGYVYRGARATLPLGAYLYGDYCTGEIWQFVNGQSTLLFDTAYSIAAFGEDESGEMYVIDLSGNIFRLANSTSPKAVVSVNAANYFRETGAAPEAIVAIFGQGLATGTSQALSLPLPLELGGTTVTIRDSNGTERAAPLFYAGVGQVNCLVPVGTVEGYAAIIVKVNNVITGSGAVKINAVAPALFTANQDGSGAASAILQLVNETNSTFSGNLAEPDPNSTGRFRPVAIDVEQNVEKIYLLLYGTGIRGRRDPVTATATIGDVVLPVEYLGSQGFFSGLDQVNVLLPKSLKGKGEVDLFLTINGDVTNKVRIKIQ